MCLLVSVSCSCNSDSYLGSHEDEVKLFSLQTMPAWGTCGTTGSRAASGVATQRANITGTEPKAVQEIGI